MEGGQRGHTAPFHDERDEVKSLSSSDITDGICRRRTSENEELRATSYNGGHDGECRSRGRINYPVNGVLLRMLTKSRSFPISVAQLAICYGCSSNHSFECIDGLGVHRSISPMRKPVDLGWGFRRGYRQKTDTITVLGWKKDLSKTDPISIQTVFSQR
jgi:hypothetical protein